MREYLELQLKKKSHEIVITVYRFSLKINGNKKLVKSLENAVKKIPASIFEAQRIKTKEDRLHHLNIAMGATLETRHYIEILYREKSISYYSYKNIFTKIELLEKMLASRIRAIDKSKSKEEYRISIRTNYGHPKIL